jgi:hypothetical protein
VALDQRANRVAQDQRDKTVKLENKAVQVQRVFLESKAAQVQQVFLESKAAQVQQDLLDHKVQPVFLAQKVQLV